MGDVLGGFTDFVGLTDYEGEEAAREQAATQSDRSYALTKEEIEFQREQYADWKAIYGPLQEDLGTYFKNLSGDKLAAKQVEAIQLEGQKAQQQTDVALAQRGLTGSGIEAQALMQNQFGTSMQKASARASADELAAQQKMGFLGLGLGQGTQMLGINAGVSNTGAQIAGNLSSSALGIGAELSKTNVGAATNLFGGAMKASGFTSFSDRRLKDKVHLVGSIKGIKFYTWEWNKIANSLGYSGIGFGVIADEIKAIIPNSTLETKEGYLVVDYSKVLKELE